MLSISPRQAARSCHRHEWCTAPGSLDCNPPYANPTLGHLSAVSMTSATSAKCFTSETVVFHRYLSAHRTFTRSPSQSTPPR
jgi:hypothetical protein